MARRSQGQGRILERAVHADGTKSFRLGWEIPHSGAVDPKTGKPVRAYAYKTVRVKGKKEAQNILADTLKTLRDGSYVAPAKVIFRDWVAKWTELRAEKLNARTMERYQELLKLHVMPTLGALALQAVTATTLDDLYAALEAKGLGVRTRRQIHAILSTIFKTAERKSLVVTNPVKRAEAPDVPDDVDIGQALEPEELTKLLDGFRESPNFLAVAVAAFTGMRRGEVLALWWTDLDTTAKTLHVQRAIQDTKAGGLEFKPPKSKRGNRTIVIDDGLLALLDKEREKQQRLVAGIPDGARVDLSLVRLPPEALVFPALDGAKVDLTRPRNPRGLTKAFSEKAKALGFNIRLHDLRVTHITMLLDAGLPVHVVAERAGHDAAVMLHVYAKRTKNADKKVAETIGSLSKSMLGG